MDDAAPFDREPPTVIVIEPEEATRRVICEYLKHCGYQVHEGTSADDLDALLAARIHVDVLLADIQLLNGAEGAELSQRMKRDHPEIQVIVTYGPNGAAHSAGDLCEKLALKKPYEPEEVLKRIRAWRPRSLRQP